MSDTIENGTPTTDSTTVSAEKPPSFLQGNVPIPPRVGEIVEGPIIVRKTAAAFIDLGPRGTGIIYGREFFLAREVLKRHNTGDLIHAKVIDPENADGYVELSVSEAGRELAWDAIGRVHDEKETIAVTVEAANRGGLIAEVSGVKGFLPVSQLASEHYPHVEGGDKEKILVALRAFAGQTLRVKILSFDSRAEKLILSERAVVEEELREELKNYHIGDVVDGTISGIVDFGLFIRFGPDGKFEGLVHTSELAWEPIANIREAFTTDAPVKVKIIDIQNNRVSLSLKALLPKPDDNETSAVSPQQESMETSETPVPSSVPNTPETTEADLPADASATPVNDETEIIR